jgi:hypothetical protein
VQCEFDQCGIFFTGKTPMPNARNAGKAKDHPAGMPELRLFI